MHGLINRSIQAFVQDTYGQTVWAEIANAAELGFADFEAMLTYEDRLTDALLAAASARLSRPREFVLEDLGTYFVSHPRCGPLRRLLRFGGETFMDFLHSLDDLQGRGRLAVPDLDLPRLELFDHTSHRFSLNCQSPHRGAGFVMAGILRAMADDYGALVMLEHQGTRGDSDRFFIEILDQSHGEAREFALAGRDN